MALSVVIITKNEEGNIERCLEAVSFADEIVVVDSDSTDRTVEIASAHGGKVFNPLWRGYGPAKKAGVDHTTSEWILSVDADEVVTPELAAEIKAVVAGNTDCDGFYMPRKTQFMGRWILHCGWYPDHLLRLFRKSHGNFNEAVVHEEVVLNGKIGYLRGELLHYCYPGLNLYFEKFNHYTTLGALEAYRTGKRARWTDIVIRPPVAFIKHYLSRMGFRDGIEGFILSVLSSLAVLVKYAKLMEKQRKGPDGNKDEQTA